MPPRMPSRDVHNGIDRRVGDLDAHEVQDDLDTFPGYGSDKPDHGPGDNRVPRGVKEVVVPAAAVDDFRCKGDEHERRQQVGHLVVQRDRLEDAPHETPPR